LQAGKIQFGFIYGMFLMGCCAMYLFLNLMSQEKSIGIFAVISILGYGLLPIVGLASIAITISLRYNSIWCGMLVFCIAIALENLTCIHTNRGYFGLVVGLVSVAWATFTASRFFEKSMNLSHTRWLLGYPVFLFYAMFVLMAVF
jgi:hypothetical protein